MADYHDAYIPLFQQAERSELGLRIPTNNPMGLRRVLYEARKLLSPRYDDFAIVIPVEGEVWICKRTYSMEELNV